MRSHEKQIEAFQDGTNVGQKLMEVAVGSLLQSEAGSEEVLEEREKSAVQMLGAVGGLYHVMESEDYVAILPCFFHTFHSDIPEELLRQVQRGNSANTEEFAFGVSLYVSDNLEEWNEWLFDHAFINERLYENRIRRYVDDKKRKKIAVSDSPKNEHSSCRCNTKEENVQ